jgi:hypothetical protein
MLNIILMFLNLKIYIFILKKSYGHLFIMSQHMGDILTI